jgi:hypothetical protein
MSKKEAAQKLRVIAYIMKDLDGLIVQGLADDIYEIAEKLDDDK